MKPEERIESACNLVYYFGGYDGDHHKQWLLDQILRELLEDKYDNWVKEFCDGEDGPYTYEWDEGIAP